MRILWVTNMPTIYRVNFFNELGKYCDLTVIFERYSATGVENKWRDSLAINFEAIFVKTVRVGREGAFSFSLLKINCSQYDEIIISSYSSPSEILLLLKMKMLRIPYMLEVDGGIIKKENFLKRKIKKFLISGADLYFSSSDKTSEYLMHYGAVADKIVKYHFSSLLKDDIMDNVNTDDAKKEKRRKLGFNASKMILAIGQFIYRKGFDVLINASKEITYDVDIVIVGGNATEEYLKLVNEINAKNIFFVPQISKSELTEYYLAADIFVLPTREDIWGLVINESMARGLPVVTTDKCISGLELIENGQNGYIVQADNPVDLAGKVNVLLNDSDACFKIGKNNLRKIQKYTIEEMAKEHYDTFCKRKKNF